MNNKNLPQTIAERLEEKLSRLNNSRPLQKSALEKLKNHLRMEMTYNSNAIEGNSLTLRETFLIINEGVTVKGKPLKDHLEARDHHAALQYLYELVETDKHVTPESFKPNYCRRTSKRLHNSYCL